MRYPSRALLIAVLLSNASWFGGGAHVVRGIQGTNVDLARARNELFVVNRDASARSSTGKFVDTFSELFDSSGLYNVPPSAIRGPAEVRARLTSDTLYSGPTASWTVLHHGVSADGRDGFTYGYFDVVKQNGDSLPGRYHAYWRRNSRGQWRILAFSRGPRRAGPLTSDVPDFVRRYAAEVRAFPMRDSTESLRQVFATERTFAESVAVDVGRAFAFFAAAYGAKFKGPSEFVFGRAGIATIFEKAPPGAGPAWEPETGTVASSNDLAFTTGPAWSRQAPRPAVIPGKYFTIWRRQPDGTWRYVVD
jgi:ketosteroid isomerase-like protein